MSDIFFFFIGALVITFLISRLVRRFAFRQAAGADRVIGPNLATLVIATVLGAFGMADGGSPAFSRAFLRYILPVAIWTVVDAIRERRASSGKQSQP
jgi:hypothetical protein